MGTDVGSGPQGEERRRHQRVPADVAIRIDVDGTTLEGRSIDVSEGGIAMELSEAPDTAKGLLIAIELADLGWQELKGELRRSEPAEGGGVRLAARFAAAATEGGPGAIREFIDRYLEGAKERP